jgi:tetratricopeptide (TPR) repeat protein
LLLLAVFAATIVVASDLYQESVFDSMRGPDPERSDFRSLDLAETDKLLATLSGPSVGKVSTRRLNHVGTLLVHRARLGYFKILSDATPLSTMEGQRRAKVEDNLWQLTNMLRMQEQSRYSFETGGYSALENYRRQSFIRVDLRRAFDFFAASWVRRPPQPEVVARLGQIQSLLGNEKRAGEFLEQSTILAPTNVRLHMTAGLTNLFHGNSVAAFPHLKRILELDPNEFVKTISLVRGFTGRISNSLDNETIARQIIPDNAEMIYNFAIKQLDADDPLRKELLDKAELLLGDVSPSNTDGILLRANILLANQDFVRGLEFLKSAVISQPFDQASRFRLTELLIEQNELDEAQDHAEELIQINAKHGPYIALLKKIKELQTERKLNPNTN